jgi:hypothetical protein
VPRHRSGTRDWLFGGRGKRRLLAELLRQPDRTWTQTELAHAAALGAKGSVDEHLLALVQLRVLTSEGRRYQLERSSPLVKPLHDLLSVIEQVPDEEIRRPP